MRLITVKAAPLALLFFLAGGAAARAATINATSALCINDTDCALAGGDWFVTTAGTSVTINGTVIPLTGIPDPTCNGCDTNVFRFSNIDPPDNPGATETIVTHMTKLSLTGVDPTCPGTGTPCNVTVSLDPTHATMGNLVVTQTVAGEAAVSPTCSIGTATGLPCEGTFTSFFDVFFDLSFTTLSGTPIPCNTAGATTCLQPDVTLNGTGSWTDDLPLGLFVQGTAGYSAPTEAHFVRQIPTPEPGTLVLLGIGLGLVALLRRRQLRG